MTIEKYQVSIRGSADGRERLVRPALLLHGLDDGERTEVWIYFEEPNADMVSGRYLGLRRGFSGGRRKLSVLLNPDSYESIYDLVRSESPIFFLYDFKDAPPQPRQRDQACHHRPGGLTQRADR